MTPPNRHTCANHSCSANRSTPTPKQTAAGSSTWLFPWGYFMEHRPLWCHRLHQFDPRRVGVVKFWSISRVLSPGRSRNLGLTWGFSTGSPWSVWGDPWPAAGAASAEDSATAYGAPPSLIGPYRPPSRSLMDSSMERSSTLWRWRASVPPGVARPRPTN